MASNCEPDLVDLDVVDPEIFVDSSEDEFLGFEEDDGGWDSLDDAPLEDIRDSMPLRDLMDVDSDDDLPLRHLIGNLKVKASRGSGDVCKETNEDSDGSTEYDHHPHTPPAHRSDGQSLLCAESMLSTSPSEDLPRYAASDRTDALPWKSTDSTSRHSLLSSKYAGALLNRDHKDKTALRGTSLGNNLRRDGVSSASVVNHRNSVPTNHSGSTRHEGNGASLDRRMNSNGLDRGAMTGSNTTTSENLPWLVETTVCQSQARQAPQPGILTSSLSGASHEQHLMLTGVFRPPLTLPEASQRIYPGSQYAPIYTTTSTSLSPYAPPLYAPSQSSLPSLGHYSYYPQYAAAHSYTAGSGAPLTGLYAGLDPGQSYSTVLAAMGSQIQHAQSQLPRSPFLPGSLPHQFAGPLTPTNSPGPSVPRSLTPSQGLAPGQTVPPGHPSLDPRTRDEKSPKIEHRDLPTRPSARMSPPKEMKHIGPLHHPRASHPMPKETSPHESLGKDPQYKIPYVPLKDRSKHRYIHRPHEGAEGRSSFLEPKHLPPPHHSYHPHFHHHPGAKSDEPPGKRSKSTSHIGGNHAPSHTGHHHSGHHPHYPGGGHPPPPPPLHPSQYPSHPHYPPHFVRGSIIQLANGELKRVEELRTDDFVHSADVSGDLKIDHSQVVKIHEEPERGTAILGFSVGEHRIQVTVEATLEHPFFVFGQGWSSCNPERTLQRYGLSCHKLAVGDVCISLTHKDANSRAAALSSQIAPERHNQISEAGDRPDRRPRNSEAEQRQIPSHTSRKERLHTVTEAPSLVAPSSRETRTTSGDGMVAAEVGRPQRKRRWSAPDQISMDTGKESPCSTVQPTGSSSSLSQSSPKMESKTQA